MPHGIRGVISEINKNGLMVSLSTSVRGLLPWAGVRKGVGEEVKGKAESKSRVLFKKGMGLRVLVRSVETELHRLIFTLKGTCVSFVWRLRFHDIW